MTASQGEQDLDQPDEALSIPVLLERLRRGDRAAMPDLFVGVETELRRIAQAYMRKERLDHTLQATALVNQAFVKFAEGKIPPVNDERHFVSCVARAMRQILIDHSRKKRIKGGQTLPEPSAHDDGETRLLAVAEALESLEGEHPRKLRVAELRLYGSKSNAEIAEILEISERTVERDWEFARAWLARALSE